MKQPDTKRPACLFCESDGEVGGEHSHADYLNHWGTHEDWEQHPSLVIAQTLAMRAGSGFYDEDDGAYDQVAAEEIVKALLANGWTLFTDAELRARDERVILAAWDHIGAFYDDPLENLQARVVRDFDAIIAAAEAVR